MSLPKAVTDDDFQELTRRVRAVAYLRGCWADLQRADTRLPEVQLAGVRLVFFISRVPTDAQVLVCQGELQCDPCNLAVALEQAVGSAAEDLAKRGSLA
jgi:hypothetical protein